MGVYSDVLAPPSVGFWFIAVVGAIFTFGSPIYWLVNSSGHDDKKSGRGALSLGAFSAVATLLLLHLFGDNRILGWVYTTPDRSEAHGAAVLLQPFGVVFWLLVIVASVVMFAAIRRKNGVSATLAGVVTLFLVQFVTGVPVFPWLVHHWPIALGLLVLNLVVGVSWAVFWKWDDLVAKNRVRYDAIRANWLKSKGLTESSDFTLEDKQEWTDYFTRNSTDEEGKVEYRPRYRDHKSELLGWMMLWPVSMFETFLFDILSDVFAKVYKKIGGVLEWVMLRRWAGTEGHMLTPEEQEILYRQQREKDKAGGGYTR